MNKHKRRYERIIKNVLQRNSEALLLDYLDVIHLTNKLIKTVNLERVLKEHSMQVTPLHLWAKVTNFLLANLPVRALELNKGIESKMGSLISYRICKSILRELLR